MAPRNYMEGWDKIEKGQNWKNNKSDKVVIILRVPQSRHGYIQLLHSSGKKTLKQLHYFMYDYSRIV